MIINKKRLLFYGISIIFFFMIPIVLDNFIFKNNMSSSITNGEWASFLGSYIGGILSGIITLAGVGLTIMYNNKIIKEQKIQFEENDNKQYRLKNRPYITVNICETKMSVLNFFYLPNDGSESKNERHIFTEIYFENIGNNAAIRLFSAIDFYSYDKESQEKIKTNIFTTKSTLKRNEKTKRAYLRFSIFENKVYNYDLAISYYDLIDNLYTQNIHICINASSTDHGYEFSSISYQPTLTN